MADQEQDKDVSRRYRELGPDEPPPALDVEIRAEARSAVETVVAPLVAPTGRRRWYFPVAAAAVIMLAVAVTSQVEREQPVETVATAPEIKKEGTLGEKQKADEQKPQSPPKVAVAPLAKRSEPPAVAQAPAAPAATEPRVFEDKPKLAEKPKDQGAAESTSAARSRDDFSRDNRARQERPAASSAAPPAAQSAPQAEAQPQRRAQADAVSGAVARGKLAEETPEAWLERIAELRRQGKQEDADKALAEFRKRYPDYKIPPAMLEKVEKK